jgi:hypothetical protein
MRRTSAGSQLDSRLRGGALGTVRRVGSPIDALLDEVRSTDWRSWSIRVPGRLWAYNPDSVVPAFGSIPAVHDETS